MVTPLASRFAVLPVDDDGDTSRRITAKMLNRKKDDQNKNQTNNAPASKKSDNKQKKPGTAKKSTDKPANSKQKPKQEGTKKKISQDQWEQWKQRDAEFVDGHYEDDLQQAMLLSKLDFEEKQEYYDQIKKASDDEKKAATKKNKKSNKAQPMSLSQFNQLGENENNETVDEALLVNGKTEADPDYFDRVKSEAKKAFQSEKAEEERKAREPLIDELISVAQYQNKVEKGDEEIVRLKEENENLKEELRHVKTRNKKLCQLLLQGEMKDKAAVLVEVDRLQRIHDELSSEVKTLAEQLEQERSKVRALTATDPHTKAKDKNKKRTESK